MYWHAACHPPRSPHLECRLQAVRHSQADAALVLVVVVGLRGLRRELHRRFADSLFQGPLPPPTPQYRPFNNTTKNGWVLKKVVEKRSSSFSLCNDAKSHNEQSFFSRPLGSWGAHSLLHHRNDEIHTSLSATFSSTGAAAGGAGVSPPCCRGASSKGRFRLKAMYSVSGSRVKSRALSS